MCFHVVLNTKLFRVIFSPIFFVHVQQLQITVTPPAKPLPVAKIVFKRCCCCTEYIVTDWNLGTAEEPLCSVGWITEFGRIIDFLMLFLCELLPRIKRFLSFSYLIFKLHLLCYVWIKCVSGFAVLHSCWAIQEITKSLWTTI